MHAEATSEKVAMGRLLAGKATAVLGTHTHVQTNDAALWRGTAYLTDCGMTGPHDSVIGVRTEIALRRFQTQLPARFEPAEGGVRLEGALIECDADGRATSCVPVRVEA
jgi:calcineurin-like phosphoesterase